MVEWLQTSYTNHTLVFILTVCLCSFRPYSLAFLSDCFLYIHVPGYQWQMHIETIICFLSWCLAASGPGRTNAKKVVLSARMVFGWSLLRLVHMSYLKIVHVHCR